MKYKYLFLFFIICSSHLIGQDDKTVDVISLKDGSVLVGKFINVTDSTYLFSISSADSIEVRKSEVLNISFDVKNYNSSTFRHKKVSSRRKEKTYKHDGWFLAVDLGMVSGREAHWHSSLTLGKRITSRFYLGIQGGKENIQNAQPLIWQTDGIWPVGFYTRYYPLRDKWSPFVSARVGYAFIDDKSQTKKSGGINILPGVGFRLPTSGKIHFLLSAHQYFQKTKGNGLYDQGFRYPVEVSYNLWYNRTVIKVGIEF